MNPRGGIMGRLKAAETAERAKATRAMAHRPVRVYSWQPGCGPEYHPQIVQIGTIGNPARSPGMRAEDR